MTAAVDFEEREENIRMIRDSAAGILEAERLANIRALRHALPGIDPKDWASFSELGWLGLRTPDQLGGSGLGMSEFCALAEELGRGLMPETVLHVASTAMLLPEAERKAVLSGAQIILPAWQEALGNPDTVTATLRDGRTNGVKRFVPYGASATGFLVTTTEGLALITADAAGATLSIEWRQDGGHWGTLTMQNVTSQKLDGQAAEAREEITLAISAYLLGVTSRAYNITREYLQTRRQFDRPIGSFQALQHRMVDLYLQIELSRASIGQAAALFDDNADFDARQCAASRAKARASDAAMTVTRSAVQLHGAIGYTDECDIGLFLRKAMVLSNSFGSSSYHRRRFARLSGLGRPNATS